MKRILFVLMLSIMALAGKAQSVEEGIKHMENENFAAALDAFNAVCKSDPKSHLAVFYIGEVNYLMEDYAEAEKSYKKGLSVNSQCAECTVGLGKLQLQKGNVVEAEKNFASALKMNKKSSSIPGFIGDAYLYNAKPDAQKAIKYLSDARDLDPSVAKYWAHLGDAYRLSGDNGEAMSAYEMAVEKDPKDVEAYISMARIWSDAKQTDLAIAKLEEAMRLAPNDARPIKDLYEIYIDTRKYEKVTPLLEKYVALTGTDIDARVRLVKFLTFQANDYERAIVEGENLLLTNPEQYTLHRWMAWSYAEKALQMTERKATDKTVTDDLIKIEWEKSFKHSKELFDALSKNEERKAFPSDYEYWAKGAFHLGDLEEAAHIYRKYLEFEPARALEIYGMLAKAYYDSTHYEQAINYYNRKDEIQPLPNTDEYYRALSYYKLDKYHEADTSLAKVLQATPNFASGWLIRARNANALDSMQVDFLAKPYYEEYIKIAETAVAAATTDQEKDKYKKSLIEAYQYVGYYWVQKEDNVKAIEYYEKIIALDPADENAISALKALKGN